MTLDLTPNSVGIWCAELKFDKDGKLDVKSHKRVDFYNKREKATAAFQQQVKAAPAGFSRRGHFLGALGERAAAPRRASGREARDAST